MQRIHAELREDVRARCPLCHERLVGVLYECAACGTRIHRACNEELGEGCTTLGCARGPTADVGARTLKDTPPAPRWWSARRVASIVGTALLFVFLCSLGITGTMVTSMGGVPDEIKVVDAEPDEPMWRWSWERDPRHWLSSLGYRWAGALDVALTDRDATRREEAGAAARALESLLQHAGPAPEARDLEHVLRSALPRATADVSQVLRELRQLPLVNSAADARAFLQRGAVLHALELVHRDVIRSSLVDALVIAGDAGSPVQLEELTAWISDEARFMGGITPERARSVALDLLARAGQSPPVAQVTSPPRVEAPSAVPVDARRMEEQALVLLGDLLGQVQTRNVSIRHVLPDAVRTYVIVSRSGSNPPFSPGLLRAAIRAGIRACDAQGEPISEAALRAWALPVLPEEGRDHDEEARRIARDLLLGLR